MDNSIVACNGVEIYQTEIDILCEEYINSLPDSNLIYKSSVFSGLLDYIYKHCLKDRIRDQLKLDFELLDNIFNCIYIPICYKFDKVPTIIQFCVLVNIDNGHISDIKNGIYRTNGTKANTNHVQTVKKWYNTCESALLGKAINESSIGSIFALKSNFGYRDNQTITVESGSVLPHESAEQIAARHAAAMLPEKPKI